MCKLKLTYKYCRNLGPGHQFAILKYSWTGPQDKKSQGSDLLIWQKNKQGEYKIIADFPQP